MAITINRKILDALEMYSTKIKNVLISYNDVINNCASTSTIKPLSAAQGKNLQDQITAINNNKLITSNSGATQTISENADFNSYTTPGTYVVSSDDIAGTISNMPHPTSGNAASGKLIVIDQKNDGVFITQIYLPTTSISLVYYRKKYNATWTSWTRVMFADMICTVDHEKTIQTSVSPGQHVTVDFSVSLSGFNPVGIIQISRSGASSGYLNTSYFAFINSNTVRTGFNNNSTSTTVPAGTVVKIRILYFKTS